jgi:uncharacterized protein
MRPWLLAVAVALAGASTLPSFCLPARAQDSTTAPVPAFHGYVNDVAGVIGGPRVAQLESFLDQLQQKTGVQFAVLTVPSCEPEEPSVFKTRVFKAWGIGNKERDDGLLLLVSMKEHAIIFETGYGLEGTLPDGWQARMLRDLAVPRFRAGDPTEGITAAVLAAAQRIAAEKAVKLEWDGRELRYDEGPGGLPVWAIIAILFVLFFVVLPILASRSNRRRRRWFYPGGWGGGFGGFGGGFGGGGFGGGGSGGGSSFGGFGGGSSGGGGGGAHW